MTTADVICVVLAFLGLAAIVGWALRSAYQRTAPRRLPGCGCDYCRGGAK